MCPKHILSQHGPFCNIPCKQNCVRSVTAINAVIKFHAEVIKYTHCKSSPMMQLKKELGIKQEKCSALMYVNIAVAVADEKECRDLVTLTVKTSRMQFYSFSSNQSAGLSVSIILLMDLQFYSNLQVFTEGAELSWNAYLLGSATLKITIPAYGTLSSLNLVNGTIPSLLYSGSK